MLGENRGLVESPLTQTARVKWNRNQSIELDSLQARIGESFALNLRQHAGEPHFAVVFEAVENIAHCSVAPSDRNGAEKRKPVSAAVRAEEIGGDSVVGLGAGFTTRGLHPLNSRCAIFAPVPPLLHGSGAVGTMRGEKQRPQRLNDCFGRKGHGAETRRSGLP